MHVGLSVIFQNLEKKLTDVEVYKHELGLLSRAEDSGFGSVWSPEHHFTGYDMIPNVTQLLSWVASRTKTIKLGTIVTVLPWHDPIRVAENFVLLDHLSDGRAIFGIGRGLGRIEFDGFKLDMTKSREHFVEYSEAILTAFETGVMEYNGEVYKQPRVEIRPAPFKSYKGRIFASAISPESIDIMAKRGAGLMLGPQKPMDATLADCNNYRSRFNAINGFEPPKPLLHMMTAVHEDADEAKRLRDTYIMRYCESAITHYELGNPDIGKIRGYEYYGATAKTVAKFGVGFVHNFMTDLNIWGTPESVAEKIIERTKYLDLGGYIACLGFGDMPPAVANANYDLFARKVIPILKKHNVGGDIGVRYGELAAA